MTFTAKDVLIPLEPGHSVNAGWTAATGFRPRGITWHWSACDTLEVCTRVLGGRTAERKGVASAHYGIGRTFEEGVHRYVSIENRSWHAGRYQTLQWDGKPLVSGAFKGTRTTIGIETISRGFWQKTKQEPVPSPDYKEAADTNSRFIMKIVPWTEPQLEMMIATGKEIVARWPNIEFRHHHGHHDLCPGYKQDVAGFPFARVLRGIYSNAEIPDVWTKLWQPIERQRALMTLGYLGANEDDGIWGRMSEAALRAFQRDQGMLQDGMWTTFVNWKVYDVMRVKGISGFFPGGAG
jgi:N-acetyl-anhydromuramyl-L-alanine amidase AmpD